MRFLQLIIFFLQLLVSFIIFKFYPSVVFGLNSLDMDLSSFRLIFASSVRIKTTFMVQFFFGN